MSNFSDNTPELDFFENFQSMAEILAEDNYQNTKNLNYSNHSFDQMFTYLKGIIKQAVNSYRQLANRAIQLQNELAKLDPFNLLLLEKTKIELNFGEAAIRLGSFAPHNSKKVDSFSRKTETRIQMANSKKSKPSNERQVTREQFDLIQQFIHENLKESLMVDVEKVKTINKNVILNLYVRWNELRGRKILSTKQKMIKTKITEQLKKIFPSIDHNQTRYRGIYFKEDIVNQEKQDFQFITHDQIPELQIEPHEAFQDEDFNLTFDDFNQKDF